MPENGVSSQHEHQHQKRIKAQMTDKKKSKMRKEEVRGSVARATGQAASVLTTEGVERSVPARRRGAE